MPTVHTLYIVNTVNKTTVVWLFGGFWGEEYYTRWGRGAARRGGDERVAGCRRRREGTGARRNMVGKLRRGKALQTFSTQAFYTVLLRPIIFQFFNKFGV